MSVVTDELLERFAREYYANSPRCPYDPETARTARMDVAYLRTSEDGVAMAHALAAVAPLIAARERERCARVADDKANEMYAIAASAQDEGDQDRCERMTYRGNGAKAAAAAIRALGDEG